ncbi:hypothetical protein [Streptomyces sp. 2231.1]|uniref:hypothetical protein n=1 Tax=Streptomyces sp. 2231.1 TaxID=1855347 RepID=UPI000B820684|nr:hypothetical protein [Streptomyces sp. 2231.1]
MLTDDLEGLALDLERRQCLVVAEKVIGSRTGSSPLYRRRADLRHHLADGHVELTDVMRLDFDLWPTVRA